MRHHKGQAIEYEDVPTVHRPTEILAIRRLLMRMGLIAHLRPLTALDMKILKSELAYLKAKRGLPNEAETVNHLSVKMRLPEKRVEETLKLISARLLLEIME